MSESYDVGTRAWQPDATEGWVASEVIKKTIEGSKAVLEFQLENGEVGSSRRVPGRRVYDAVAEPPLSADQDARGLPRGPPVREQPVTTTVDEPDYA